MFIIHISTFDWERWGNKQAWCVLNATYPNISSCFFQNHLTPHL